MRWGWPASDEPLIAHLRDGGALRWQAWDVLPSRGGGSERVEVVVTASGDGFVGACELLPAEFGQHEERWQERWREAELRRVLAAVRASPSPSMWWG